MVKIFLTDGFEETEAITTADILFRAGIDYRLVSLTGKEIVRGSRGVKVVADTLFESDNDEPEAVVLPGGQVLENYRTHETLTEFIKSFSERGLVAAICAAPMFLAEIGLLRGKKILCYPSFNDEIATLGAIPAEGVAVRDGNFVTSKGPGTTPDFALEIIRNLKDEKTAEKVAAGFLL
jgi:4-methyl-5(b-hydroxyethyl)-thiazole monophosphate biosynthesis